MGSALSRGLSGPPSSISTSTGCASPTKEVLQVYHLLLRIFPPELAITILDDAEFWVTNSTMSSQPVVANAGPTGARACTSALVSAPIPRGGALHAVRRIEIMTESRDQGFSSFPQYRGTREGSSSYFEASLVRPSKDVDGPAFEMIVPRCILFYNLHAIPVCHEHTHVLERGHPIIDAAEEGDAVVLYCVAQWPMWVNECRKSRITIKLAAV